MAETRETTRPIKTAQAVREAVAHDAMVSELIDAMLNARAALWKEYCRLHDLVVKLVAGHELCRRFMQIPGVGPIAALSFMTAVDDPSRFRRSRDVAAYFGLTSRRWQSGSSIDVKGRISKAGDGDVRRALYEAASALLTRYRKKGQGQELGAGAGEALLAPQGRGGGGAQARRDHARDVDHRHLLLRRSGHICGGDAGRNHRQAT